MIKYYLTAAALRLFSMNAGTKRVYRAIGNTFGNFRRLKRDPPYYYLERLGRNLKLCKKHGILRDGGCMLEVGTGWVHWEALTLGLVYPAKAVLYDVWDNRQFPAFRKYVEHLKSGLLDNSLLSNEELATAIERIKKIDDCSSFDEVYEELGWCYVVERGGSFDILKNYKFDYVASASVFEHIHRSLVEDSIAGWSSLLKPGGYASHSIDISDHLSHYDSSAAIKQYLAFDERTWSRWFANDVQYINRIQRSEWLELFEHAGLEIVELEDSFCDIEDGWISSQYKCLCEKDLKCRTLKVLLRKPE